MAETSVPRHVTEHITHPESTFAIQDESDGQAYADALARKAARYIDQGKYEEAENCAKLGLDRVSDHTDCMSYLAICVAQGSQKFVVAERLAKQTVSANPDDGRAMYALGRVNLLRDRRKIAFNQFGQSRDMAGRDRTLRRELDRMDPRRPPILAGLPRNHFLNILLGWLRARLLPGR